MGEKGGGLFEVELDFLEAVGRNLLKGFTATFDGVDTGKLRLKLFGGMGLLENRLFGEIVLRKAMGCNH